MKTVLIIDDEAHSRENLKSLISTYCPSLIVVGEADGVDAGFELIQSLKPQAIFLDISMQDGTGFDLLDRFERPEFQVVFQTAFDEFAIKAFRYNAIDYLLKPVSIEDLILAANKLTSESGPSDISQQLSNLIELTKNKSFEKLVLNSSEGMHFVEIAEIIRLESDVNYTTFFLSTGERITVTKTIKTFEELLPETLFFRPHQSHIVNLQCVTKILREDGGYALLKDGSKVPISRMKKDPFLTILQKTLSDI